MSRVVLNSTANSGPSVGASSLVTDANSAFPGGPQLQRSASINTESYLRLPASPMSFSSNNISISGSSVVDGSSMMQQNSHQDQSSQHMQQRQPQQGASSATSHPTPQTGQVSVPTGSQARNLLTQEPNYLYQMQKKPRLDIKQDDLQKQVFQQLLQRQDSMQFQGHNPQLQALIQQQRLRHQQQQQQQILQSIPPMQRAQLQQQQQLRNQLQQQNMQPVSATQRPYESGICARRLMKYIYHQSHRPPDNSIAYWRKFVTEYFSPRAKKRWCLSMYANVGQHALGVFPQAAMDAWHCDICGSKSGRGFEATSEVLPRLNKIKFDSGVVDELLFLDMPREWRLPSGIMLLEYGKAVQESVYEQLRVVREGQLRIVFTNDLKILSWEFCARRHEELLPRRLVAPQVNQLVQVAQKYQSTISESGSNGISPQELQTNCNMFLTVGRQLAKNLELQSLNDLGFSKRYVRCLQISEVVNSMKDLIDISREHNVGPIETLKNYPRQTAAAKLQMQKMQELEQLASAQGLPTDQNTLNKLMALNPNLGSNINNNHHMVGTGILNGSAQPSLGLSNYQNLLRQNSINSNPNSLRQEPQCSFNSNMDQSSQVQGPGPGSSIMGSLQNAPANGLSSSNLLQQQQQQQSLNGGNLLNQNHLQQQMIQQLMQEMMSNNGGMPQQQPQQNAKANVKEEILSENNGTTIDGLTAGGMVMVGNSLGFRNNNSGTGTSGNVPNRSNSFKAMSESNGFNQKAPDVLHSLHLPDIVQDMSYDFSDF